MAENFKNAVWWHKFGSGIKIALWMPNIATWNAPVQAPVALPILLPAKVHLGRWQ